MGNYVEGKNRRCALDTLQTMFESELRKALTPEGIGATLIERKLAELGIALSEEQRSDLETQLSDVEADEVQLELDENWMMNGELVTEVAAGGRLQLTLEEDETEEALDQALRDLGESIPDLASELSADFVKHIRAGAVSEAKKRRRERRRFERSIERLWRDALTLLEVLIVVASEYGDAISEGLDQDEQADDLLLEVLTRLQARACQVSSEVLTLLRCGYADGAHARWRTLHEIAVVAMFVTDHGKEAAMRYVCYDAVEAFKAARQYQGFVDLLGYEPIDSKEYEDLKADHEAMVKRFGKSFKNQNGWAAEIVGKDAPRFSDIEKAVGMERMRPFYRMASHNVHANPRGVFYKLGLLPSTENVLLAGPSVLGLAEPGQGTALALVQITTSLVTIRPNLDGLVWSNALLRLAQEAGRAFWEIQQRMEKE